MKIFKRVVIFVLIFIVIFVISFYLLIKFKGKDLLIQKLKTLSKRNITISELQPTFPLNIYIKDLKIEGLFEIKEAHISLLPFNLSKQFNLSFVKISKPTFIFDTNTWKITDKKTIEKKLEENLQTQLIPSYSENKKFYSFFIKHFVIEDGTFYFIDKVKLKIENINADIYNFSFNRDGIKALFNLTGKTKWNEKEYGTLAINGWIDNFKKNMDVNLNFQNIDYDAFKEYYPPFWKPENLGISKAYVSLFANLNSKKNNLVIDTYLSLEKIDFIENFEDESKIKYLKTVLALLKLQNEKPTINFKINTKMDSPKLDFSDIKYDLKGVVKFSPTYIFDRTIEKTKNNVSKNLKNIKQFTIDNTLNAIKRFLDMLKNFIKFPNKVHPEKETRTDIKVEIEQNVENVN